MYKRNPTSVPGIFSQVITALSTKSNLIHTAQSKHPFHSPFTLEVLASNLAPVLQRDPSLSPSVFYQAQQIHAQITVNGLQKVGILGTRILGMYILCNKYFDAKELFFQLNLCYAAPWNWMIRCFTMAGYFDFAILFYFKMLDFGTWPDKYTFPYVIKACGGLRSVKLVTYIHGLIKDLGFEKDVYVGSALVKFYADNECIETAHRLFDKLPLRDSVLWNVMLNGFVKCGNPVDNVIGLFVEMRNSVVRPNSVTYACILSVCGSEATVGFGTQIHGLIVRCGLDMDTLVTNTLVTMYAKCRCLFDARKLFDSVKQADRVTWNGMIGGYVQNGYMDEALDLFRNMISLGVKPDSVTFASLLPSVSHSENFTQGEEIHGYIIRHGVTLDVFLKNALIDMLDLGHQVFTRMSERDSVCWNSIITSCSQNGKPEQAIDLFRCMGMEGAKYDCVSISAALSACANLPALHYGKEIHDTSHPQSAQIYLVLKNLLLELQKEGYVPQLYSLSQQLADTVSLPAEAN
ncbi:unnamed protein product [Fraxinus pennsylvanica]|uniref:Pentatricopeptide repeat-containing protein n=1 Tax=Fraxinus pennsylvanica TaxID=56036 RepID=A0AAD1ZNX5_9LAMI|nr:unnamed protein product [Fraxinus pennsylvanica]